MNEPASTSSSSSSKPTLLIRRRLPLLHLSPFLFLSFALSSILLSSHPAVAIRLTGTVTFDGTTPDIFVGKYGVGPDGGAVTGSLTFSEPVNRGQSKVPCVRTHEYICRSSTVTVLIHPVSHCGNLSLSLSLSLLLSFLPSLWSLSIPHPIAPPPLSPKDSQRS